MAPDTKMNRYYASALGLYVSGVIGLCALFAVGLTRVWVPLAVLGVSSWVAAGVLAVTGRSLVDRSGGGWLEGGLVLCLGLLGVIGLVLLFAAALSAAEWP